MPPPKKTQRELHRLVATLYSDGVIDTRTSLGQVLTAVARRAAEPGASDYNVDLKIDAFKKSLHRAYKADTDRLARLWQGVVEYADRPAGEFMHIDMPREALDRLKIELRTSDPVFSAVTAALQAAQAATTPEAVVDALRAAVELLAGLTPSSALPEGADDTERNALVERLTNISGAYGQVYDLAIGDGGTVPQPLLAVAQHAIQRGYAARTAARTLRQGPMFGYRAVEGPRSVNWYGSDIWIGAVAVLMVLQGVPTDQVVPATRAWVVEHLDTRPEAVRPAEVLTHAAETLVRVGRRHEARAAVAAAWSTGSTSHVWEELLDLSITLAAASFGHGERDAADELINGEVRSWLEGDYPGDPDEGWGSSVDVGLYRLVQAAVEDPTAAAAPLRRAWAADVGAGGHRRRTWVLTALLVECLVSAGDLAGAAEIARLADKLMSRRMITQLDAQLAAHLSEMFSTERTPSQAATTGHVAALLEELTRVVLREPDAVHHDQRDVLVGLAAVADAARFGTPVGRLAG